MSHHPDEPTDDESASPPNGAHAEPRESDAPSPTGTATPDGEPAPAERADDRSFESRGSGMRGRDVEVPMRVYKTVTVFSTLIAVVCVVGGFIVLDRATGRAQLPLSEVDPLLAILGVGTILFGAAIYAFGTRFRAAGMGSSKNDDDEAADNG